MNLDEIIGSHPASQDRSAGRDSRPTLQDVADETNLLRAWDKVRRNDGAPGVDRITITELEPQFPAMARDLAALVASGRYRPKPVRRVEVPKMPSGTRKLGIPTVLDRLVQQAVLQALQPAFEPAFSRSSFAYRPGRGPLDAIRHVQRRIASQSTWVLHFDVKDFFDSVPHALVLEAVSRKVADRALLELIHHCLTCGVVENGSMVPTVRGVAQGSPLSPLLANAVLDALDQWLETRGALFARYADDCAVLVDENAEGERIKGQIVQFLSTLSLQLNERKTTLTPPDQAEFLGFSFRIGRSGKCERIISDEALGDFRAAAEARAGATAEPFESKAAGLATLVQSWLGYFGATEDPRQIAELLEQTEQLLRWEQWSGANSSTRRRLLQNLRSQPETARRLSEAAANDPSLREPLRSVFPATFLGDRGLAARIPPPSPTPRSSALDYSGRLQAGIPGIDWGTPWREWTWRLLEWQGFAVRLGMAKHCRAMLPRIDHVALELGRHKIIFRSA